MPFPRSSGPSATGPPSCSTAASAAGADVLKAIALGARAVLLGRPYAYGLAVDGEQGVRDVLVNLIADLDLTLGLAGCASLGELGPDSLQVVEPASGVEGRRS